MGIFGHGAQNRKDDEAGSTAAITRHQVANGGALYRKMAARAPSLPTPSPLQSPMYSLLLTIHSWSRWLVLLVGAWAIFRAVAGERHSWTKSDNIAGASFVGSMHLQLLVGLILYFGVSPFGMQAFQRLGGEVMKNPESRFWGVEHTVVMLVAVICAQVGRSLSKKAASADPASAHRKALIWFGIALVLVLLMIPWGIWNPARPLFRL